MSEEPTGAPTASPENGENVENVGINELLGSISPVGEESPLKALLTSEDIDMKSVVKGSPPHYIDLVRGKFFGDRYNLRSVNLIINNELKLLVSRDRKGRTEILKAISAIMPSEAAAALAEGERRGFFGRLWK